ncbi:MAG: Crp/Fnr family transcriptional regulator [Lysobacterales bacterium]
MNKVFQQNSPGVSTQSNKLGTDTGTIPDELFPEILSKTKTYLAKEVIHREADAVDKVYYIRGGMVKLLSYLHNGRARIVRLHAGGHWLGLEGLVGQPYEHTAVAVDDVETYYFSVKHLQQLEHDNSRRYLQIVKQVYGNLAQADRWIADFSTGGIRARVARLLEFLSKLKYGNASGMVELLTVHEMADMLGVTPESVSRILAEFKRNETLTLHKPGSKSNEIYKIDSQKLHPETLH